MSFVSMKDTVDRAFRQGYAVPSFCAWNAEAAEAILRVAERLRAPVILMHSPVELSFLPPAVMAAVACAVKRSYDVPAVLHLDHGDSPDLVRDCIASGYTSVMLDYSARSFTENAEALREVCALAHPRGIAVEGEIGKVGKAEESALEGTDRSRLTDPGEAVEYVRRTGVDLLAVSIGNQHGFYRSEPRLDFGLLAELHAALQVPLVLHGGTGISAEDIRRSIGLGIAKINVASEMVHGFRDSLTSQWNAGRNLWLPMALGEAMSVVEQGVEKWIRITGAEGQA